ncbi:helix-turn-helix domain-containing protein [Aestuariirhabdus sp. Z084]|uniref:ArsR/SmtB family transcription factor n=1 Tax=Aestuariirhabdus haliotis TaxID=2918751 RepID=UPI00201B3DF1|nr:metalloregulator ArsR/SmtB family transcription factor [Aestuariirhabdus haliotis]MCL6415255.1 helix-turn-helix domain-containing protein [Aestuariirhabdus haliotis]MCL6419515.1 helix-turn-helix domain-containing protein [Aestuariirhabdus haliotis]
MQSEVREEIVLRTQQLAKAFKALSNENRLTIYLEILRHREGVLKPDDACGCMLADIIQSLNIGAPTISHHMKELINADLIEVSKQGKFIHCRVNPDTQYALEQFFSRSGKIQLEKESDKADDPSPLSA